MILIAGGTGTLGTRIVRLLKARGLEVRLLLRDLAREPEEDLVEVVPGDVLDPRAVERATGGTRIVVSAIQGFSGSGVYSPRTVDYRGNSNLIQAARTAGVEHFILVSVHGAAPDHPMELFRMKFLAEQELRESGLAWTIIRPTAYMETWANILGKPLLKTKRTRIFGRGNNPINFVSADDVARYVELAVVDQNLRGGLMEVGGPENLTMNQFVGHFEVLAGKEVRKSHVPLLMMRLMTVLMRPVNPTLARQVQAGVVMDTHDMSFDLPEADGRHASVPPPTSLTDVVARDYAA
jgi:uncharacterized protein YbjT (DUF2867 family)